MGLVVLSVMLIPVGVLISGAVDPKLHRRPRFALRFTVTLSCVILPDLVLGAASIAGVFGTDPSSVLLGGLGWSLALLPLAPRLLFEPPGFDPGQSDEGGGGPHSGDDRPSPPPPMGGLPLADAEQSSVRLRGPRPRRRSLTRQRPAREPQRSPRRVLPPGRRPGR